MTQSVPLRRLFRVVNGGTPTADERNWGGDVPWATPADFGATLTTLRETRRYLTSLGARNGSAVVPSDSILVSTRAPIGYVALAGHTMAFNQGCRALVATADVDYRFFGYQLEGMTSTLQANGLGTTFPELSSDSLAAIPVVAPPIKEQRRIADFLDTETTRMDALTSKLEDFESRVREREKSALADVLRADFVVHDSELPAGWRQVPLMHLTDQSRPIMYGIVLPGPHVEDGVPIIKGGDVGRGDLSAKSLARTSRQIEASYARSRLKGGDLVIAIRGSVGEVTLVPNDLEGANLTQDAARISVGHGVDRAWLKLVLESPIAEHQVQQRTTGATIKGVNIRDLKRIVIPTPHLSDQRAVARSLGSMLDAHENLRRYVAEHRTLVKERRTALITAAVTGQFDVSTASGRGVTEHVTT